MRALKMTALLMVAAAAVLVPLYGDPRGGTVTHPDWAGMLVRALELEGGLPENATPAQVFSALSWKGSLVFTADARQRATGIAFQPSGSTQAAVATEAEGEIVYPLTIITGGDYRVRARMSGAPDHPTVVEFVPAGRTDAAGNVSLAPSAIMGWVDGGAVHLDHGAYSAVVRLPAGAALEMIEVAPPCISPVEPLRGWSEPAIADAVDVAVTVIQAIDAESELPPAAAPIEVTAESFKEEISGPGPRRAVVFVDLPEAGLYTISIYGIVGGGQGWSADACRKAMMCPILDPALARQPQWRTLMTAPFTAGRHSFTVTLQDAAAVQRLRAEQKKNTGADYVATLRRLGLDVGDGPVSRAKAKEAAAFVQQRAAALLANHCGDITLPDGGQRVIGFQPASFARPGVAPGESGLGPNPIANPPVPLDLPTPTPAPTPSPTPTAPPSVPPSPPGPTPPPTPPPIPPPTPGPSPSPTPTPSPIPTQPPGSSVTPSPGPGAPR